LNSIKIDTNFFEGDCVGVWYIGTYDLILCLLIKHVSFHWSSHFLPVHSRLMDDTRRHAQQIVLPQLSNQLQKVNSGIQECLNIRTAINEW